MEELKNLQKIYSLAAGKFNQYDGNDFVLPRTFKEQVKEINGNSVTYNDYSAIIQTKGSQRGFLNIFLPNQWFYMASYFTDFYNELILYKKYALKVATKERLKVLDKGNLTDEEMQSLYSLPLNDTSKSYLNRFITDYEWWHGAKTIDRGDFYVSPILACACLVNASQSYVADLCAFLADKQELARSIVEGVENLYKKQDCKGNFNQFSLQQIFYGAPGTGKSHTINEETQNADVIRTTFHPDTDYSTFVGAYKPTTKEVELRDLSGHKVVEDGEVIKEDRIVYEFVAQSFLQAYVGAWKKYADANEDEPQKQYLVIEEINRGNCAQIFGDLFQLLDRNDKGFSDYPIKADADMKRQLQKAFTGLDIAQKNKINALYKGKDVVSQVLGGEILLLPNNLYIWATMNTSDQSLFPIDSAFKRRWDWTYMPISNAEMHWVIEVNGYNYDWWQFLEKINEKIGSTTNSEDKKLGYFFCKAQDGVISAKTFIGKVIFYLWNDVFKDYEFGDAIFNDEDGSKLSFDKFYTSEGKNSKVVEEKVALFLKNLGLIPMEFSKEESEIEDEDGNTPESNSRNYDKFTVNDGAECAKNKLAIECIKEYVRLNPDITAQEVYEKWTSLGSIVPHFIETKEQFDSRTDNSKRSDAVDCYGTPIYVARNGYGSNGKADILMKLVNEKNWGITIKKIIK